MIYRCNNSACLLYGLSISLNPDLEESTCRLCHGPLYKVKDISDDGWLAALAEDPEYWVSSSEEYPSVIAHEYSRLKSLFHENRPFAALFQLKDCFESLLKYEVLSAWSWATDCIRDDQFFQKTLSQITISNPPLGTWLGLSELLIRDLNKIGMELPAVIPLDPLSTYFKKQGIVKWRNLAIGHSALGLETDIEFREKFRNMLITLRNGYLLIDSELRKNQLWLEPKKQGRNGSR